MTANAHAFIAVPGKSALTHLRDTRLRVYPGSYSGELHPDFIVIPCSQMSRFDPTAISLPASVQERLCGGQAHLVLDASLEGVPHQAECSRVFHRLLGCLRTSPANATYVTQDRQYAADYARFCKTEGLQPMQVLNYDFWIRRFFCWTPSEGETIFASRLQAFEARLDRRPRRFLSLNWTPRPHKVLFLLRLLDDGLWGHGFVSFSGFDELFKREQRFAPQFQKALRRLQGFEDLAEGLLPQWDRLDSLGQIALGPTAARSPSEFPHIRAGDETLEEYDTSWFSVVTESEMMSRPCRVTEKPFKALVNFHPFLMLGNPGSLKMIRDLGFQTYPTVFDESYDDEPEPRRRFEFVYQQVSSLCRADERALTRLISAVREAIIFNAEWGLTRLPEHFTLTADAALADALLQRHRAIAS